MTPPKATAKTPAFSFGDFGKINGQLGGQKPKGSKGGAKPAAKPKAKPTPVENNEAGIIKFKGLTLLTDSERGRALRAGSRPGWTPFVSMARVRGTHKPQAPLMRPADDALPVRASGSVSRPAGRGTVAKTSVPKPNNSLGVLPRPKPADSTMAMGLTVTYGGETKLNGGQPIDANYFTDVADLK
jgi:hypothetical protein